jgi:hypothetical protein
MLRNSIILGCTVLIFTFVFATCKHPLPEPLAPVAGIPGSTGRPCNIDSVYFANDILPLLNASCATSGCHDAATKKDGVQLTDYDHIMEYIDPGDPSGSKLYKVIIRTDKDRMPEPPNPPLTDAQKAKIQKWIQQGARNNVCDRCDTSDARYSTAVKTILENKCKGCHNPAVFNAGIDLSSYSGTQAAALNGKLYGAISWSSGFSAMPKGGYKLPGCEITTIRKWIDSGAPNN